MLTIFKMLMLLPLAPQFFMGKFLQRDKFVICVAGTHGKSTTNALVGLILEKAGFNPTVEVGALVKEWNAGVRHGKSKYFVCEGDEFNNNFLNYSPSLLIINNIEMDHPEFFKDFDHFLNAFERLLKKMVKPKILVVNEDSFGIRRLLLENKNFILKNSFQVIGYRLGAGFSFPFENRLKGEIERLGKNFTNFSVSFGNEKVRESFSLRIPGIFNVSNSLGVLACLQTLNIELSAARAVLAAFAGLGRRLEEKGREKGVLVIDDYAVHPTSVGEAIKAIRQKYPNKRIWAVFEPHQFSRLKIFKKKFVKSLEQADKVIVTRVFPGREQKIKGVSGKRLAFEIGSPKAVYIEDFDKIAEFISQEAEKGDVVLVFGAGESYKLSQKILDRLRNE